MQNTSERCREIISGGYSPHYGGPVYSVYEGAKWLGFIYTIQGRYQARPGGFDTGLPLRETREAAAQDF